MVFSFLAFTLWWIALSYLAFPRILFAWGMDRMGPKWFTDINPRFASPVKNHILCFVLGRDPDRALRLLAERRRCRASSVTALEIFSVFGVTAIAALLFPYSKRAKGIWDASPYKTWKLARHPGGDDRRRSSTSSTWASWPYFFFFQPTRQAPRGLHPQHRPSSSP